MGLICFAPPAILIVPPHFMFNLSERTPLPYMHTLPIIRRPWRILSW